MSFPKRTIPLTWLAGILLLNFLLKVFYVGHFLTWDEAWVLGAMKGILGGKQLFSLQLWKHPPLYLGLGMLLQPQVPGIEIRMQF